MNKKMIYIALALGLNACSEQTEDYSDSKCFSGQYEKVDDWRKGLCHEQKGYRWAEKHQPVSGEWCEKNASQPDYATGCKKWIDDYSD